MKRSINTLMAFALAGSFITGCEKIDSIPTRFTPIPGSNTNVKFLMMSPDAPTINFFANGIKSSAVAPTTTGAVQGVGFPSIFPATIGYATLPAGTLKIDAIVPEASAVMPGQTVFSSSPAFASAKFYTYALVDSLSRVSAVVIEDDPTVADVSKAYIRIANFIPNSPVKIEVVKTSSGAAFNNTYNNVAFKSVSAFEPLSAGAGETYRVFLRNPVTDAKLDSISAFVPTNTKKYTIYARGVLGQTGNTNTRRPIITNFINF